MIERLCIFGLGLIGGSLALALKQSGFVGEVVGCSRSEANLKRALERGLIDRYDTDPATAVKECEVVFLATPLGAMDAVLQAMQPGLSATTVITDGGSAKAGVVAAARQYIPEHIPRFVPGHPIAGTERSGVEAGFAELYQERRVILTPLDENSEAACATVKAMWLATGAQVETMSVEHHDKVLAATSHLPHMLAFSLVHSLAQMNEHDEIFRYAAGGFRDFTRIASSDPVMWRDICLANREALAAMLHRFGDELSALTASIEQGDSTVVEELFTRAKAERDQLIGQC